MSNFPISSEEHLREQTLSSEQIFEGKIITIRRDEVALANGHRAIREVAEHPGGVVVCPFLDDGRIILVRQWRYPLERTLLELPAGKLDYGEEPFPAIQRELEEETGYQASQWKEITYLYPAPGFCDERLWLYRASGLSKPEHRQTPDEDEILDIVFLTPEEAWRAVRNREIVDAKSVALLALCLDVTKAPV